MKRLLYSALACTGLALTLCHTCSAETLEEIYKLALDNDHRYKAAKATYESEQENTKLGRAALLPKITGRYSWEESQSSADGIRNSEVVSSDNETTTTVSGYAFDLEQPLFNLQAWYGYKQVKYLANISEVDYRIEEQSMILRTATAYFDALQADEALQTAFAEERALSQQLEQSKKRFEVGLTAITEVHEAQAAFDSAIAVRIAAEGNKGIAFEALEVITGKTISQLAPLKTDFPVGQPVPANRQDWVELALDKNLPLKKSSLNSKASQSNAKVKRSEHLPTVTGKLTYANNSTSDDIGFNDFNGESSSISVTVNVPIFTGGSTSASRRQAEKQYLASKELFRQTQRDTIQASRSAHLAVLTGVATVQARKQAIKSSKSALDATQSGYEVGTRDLVDVLNSQRNLYRAEKEYQEALYDYILNSLNLKQVAGVLNASDISELDVWLDKQRSVTYAF